MDFVLEPKARFADSCDNEFIVKSFLCMTIVDIVSLCTYVAKIGIPHCHCRLTQISLVSIKPQQRKSFCCIIKCFNSVLQMNISREF